MTATQHRSESARYRRLYDDTGITAYSVASAHHAGMAGDPLQLPGAMAIMAIVAIHKTESERREVASLRDGLADTQELPVVETTADLARDDRAGCLPLVPLSRARESAGGAL